MSTSFSKTVDYFLSPVSPWTYLGHPRLTALVTLHKAQVRIKPADIGKVFAVSGGVPLKQRPMQRQLYRMQELKRWRDYLKVPLTLEPKYFPYAADTASHLIIAADKVAGTAVAMRLAFGFLRGCWAEEKNCADPDTIAAIVQAEGLHMSALQARMDEAKALYETYTQEAITRNVFGVPTYIIDDRVLWGQDRLDFVERMLA
ncbi:MAG: 2-hydroxychromene-2-carboxylate isomerase [Betaproteobacteria bacterium]|nr:2-hydroxychromene-2-carboxylate isomerase [Betaproteobacteria bacterium]